MAPLVALVPPSPAPGTFWLHVLDVGQGLAAVVRTEKHALVFDAGPSWNPDADSGNRIVVPFLRGEGIRNLDTLIVSHADDDHSGGAASIIAARAPSWVMTSMSADAPQVSAANEIMKCEAGDTWRWDGVDFDILHPTSADYERDGIKTNNMGCVLKVSVGGKSVLLTADIEKLAEQSILSRYAEDADMLKSTVLVIPHHGSRTSSTEAFLDAVVPEMAILPVGYRNRFRHPNGQVMQRYAERRIPVHRTDTSGAITVRVVPDKAQQVEHFRMQRKRYWIEAPDLANEETVR
jgi:competence protein ComEC